MKSFALWSCRVVFALLIPLVLISAGLEWLHLKFRAFINWILYRTERIYERIDKMGGKTVDAEAMYE